MATIAPVNIGVAPAVPDSTVPEPTFDVQYQDFNTWEKNVLQPGINATAANVFHNANEAAASAAAAATVVDDVQEARDAAEAAAAAAASAANFVGAWSELTGPLAMGATAYYAPQNWQLLEDVADVTAHVPGVSAVWVPSLQLKTLNGESLIGYGDLEMGGDVTATLVQRTFSAGEQRMITLDSPIVGAALVSVQREIPQLGVSTNFWQSVIGSNDFVLENYAPAVAITIGAAVSGVAPVTLASGNWSADDVGRRIEGAGGVAVIQSYVTNVAQAFVVTAFTSGSAVSGGWALFGLSVQEGRLRLGTKAGRNYAANEGALVRTAASTTPHAPGYLTFLTPNGQYMYAGNGSANTWARFTLIAPFDVSNYSATALISQSVNPSTWRVGIKAVKNAERIWSYQGVNTNWTVAEHIFTGGAGGTALTAGKTAARTISGGTENTSGYAGLAVTADGLNLYTSRNNTSAPFFIIQRWTLTVAWDLDTLSAAPIQEIVIPTVSTILDVEPTGKVLYLQPVGSAATIPLIMPTPNSFTGAYAGTAFTLPSGDIWTSMCFADDGKRMYLASGTVKQYDISGTTIPVNVTYPAIYASGVDTEFWTAARDLAVVGDEGTAHYAVSTDGRVTWYVSTRPDGLRPIVRNNAGTWQLNSSPTYTGTSWANATVNTELGALRQAVTDVAANRMTKVQLVAGRSWDLPSLDIGTLVSNAALTNAGSGAHDSNTNILYAGDGSRFWTFDNNSSSNASLRIREWTPTTTWGVTQTGAPTNYTLGATARTDSSYWPDSYFKPFWSEDGIYLYLAKTSFGGGSQTDVVRYATSTPWRAAGLNLTPNQTLSNATLAALAGGATFGQPSAFFIAAGGTRMYMADSASRIHQFLMPTPYSLVGMTYGGSFVFSSTGSATARMSSDGRTVFVAAGTNAASVRTLELSTPFDITTATLTTTTTTGLTSSTSFEFGQVGSYFYALNPQAGNANALFRRLSAPLGNTLPLPSLDDQLDIAVMLSSTSVTTPANTQGLSIVYDANTTYENLLPGTNYTYTQPSDDKVLFKALTAGNLKVRIA